MNRIRDRRQRRKPPSRPHTGLGHLRENWDHVATQLPRQEAENKVARVTTEETFGESGARALPRLMDAVEGDSANMTVLEFGCGLGRVTRHLDTLFEHVFAVDIAPGMVAEVEKLGLEHTTGIVDDGHGLEGKMPQVDLLYSDSVLLHNLKSDVRQFWPKVCGRIKAGGMAAFQVPCYEHGSDPSGWIDVGVWTRPELEQLAELSGCTVETIWVNPGRFSYQTIGPVHHGLHIFRKI